MKTGGRSLIGWVVFLAVAMALMAGCSDDSDDGAPAPAGDVAAPVEQDEDHPVHPMFPDGLHPNGDGAAIIAQVFARQIVPLLGGGGTNVQTVVCLGDSITAGGYPAELADQTGLTVINAGKGGERSDGGVGRIGGLIAGHQPDFICILYGANDVHCGVPANQIAANVGAMAQAAINNGVTPVVGTLTPVSGPKYKDAPATKEASAAIRRMVGGIAGARLADLEAAF